MLDQLACVVTDSLAESVEDPETIGLSGLHVIGRLGNMTKDGFVDALDAQMAQTFLDVLVSCNLWKAQSDWYLTQEFTVNDRCRVHVSYENNQRSTTVHRHNRVSDNTYRYQSPTDTVVQVALEREFGMENPDQFQEFVHATSSLNRYFLLACESVPGVMWRYQVQKTWMGKSASEAEHNMLHTEPTWSVRCEMLNLPSVTGMSEEQTGTLMASMFLKLQDLLDIPRYKKVIQTESSKANPIAPIRVATFERL
jgi:hypothetical protein